MKARTGGEGVISGNGGHRTLQDHPRVPVDEGLRTVVDAGQK